jgi:hypothetical protein
MNTSITNTPLRRRTLGIIALSWVVILAKCLLVAWAIDHWRVPVHAGWVIWPTVMFAGLATLLWAGNRD